MSFLLRLRTFCSLLPDLLAHHHRHHLSYVSVHFPLPSSSTLSTAVNRCSKLTRLVTAQLYGEAKIWLIPGPRRSSSSSTVCRPLLLPLPSLSLLLPYCPSLLTTFPFHFSSSHASDHTGAVLGLLQTPLCALIALGSEDSVRAHRAEVHNSVIREMEEAPPALNTEFERVAKPEKAHMGDPGTYGRARGGR